MVETPPIDEILTETPELANGMFEYIPKGHTLIIFPLDDLMTVYMSSIGAAAVVFVFVHFIFKTLKVSDRNA